jgi:hypothetical protein
MTSTYELLINDLKQKLNKKRISFKTIFNLIMAGQREEIINILSNDSTIQLIKSIMDQNNNINILKDKLQNINISFKKIYNLIKNNQLDEIINMLSNKNIIQLITNIKSEIDIEGNTNILKEILKNNSIPFKKIKKLIANNQFDDIIKLFDNNDILLLIYNVKDYIRQDYLRSINIPLKLIKNNQLDDIINILNNDDIILIVNNIFAEIDRICFSLRDKLNDAIWLNDALIKLDKEPQSTRSKAIKILRTVNINIFDFEAGLFHKQTTYKKLKEDIKKNPHHRCFPLELAKTDMILGRLLKKI